jgi:DNA repair exonuclease SbcCD ATPase subunit
MIQFQMLRIAGFMPFTGGPYDIPLADQGLVAVVGENQVSAFADSNGVGKTAIVDALTWALYNRILRDSVPADQIINQQANEAEVTVEFSVDGRGYSVVNHRERRGRRSWTLYERDSDGRSIGEPIDTTETKIEHILGLSFLAFSNTLLFGQGPRFADQRDSDRKKIFDDLIDTAFLGEKRKIIESEIEVLVNRCEALRSERLQLAASMTSMHAQQAQLIAGFDADYAARLEQWFEFETLLDGQARAVHREIMALRDLQRLERYYERESVERALLSDALVQHRALINNREGRLKESVSIQTALQRSDVCPVCRRPGLRNNAAAETYYKALIAEMSQEIQRLKRIAVEYEMARESYWIEQASDARFIRDRVSRAKELFDECLTKLELLGDMHAPHSQQLTLEWYERELTGVTARVSEIDETLRQLEPDLAMREFWKEGFGSQGLRSIILSNYEGFLNARLTEYSRILTMGEIDIKIHARTPKKSGRGEKEQIFFDVINAHGGQSYDYQSEGEKQRVDLAVVLALQDLVREVHRARMNIAFYDEIFDHLDETGAECAMQFLLERRESVGSIFLISQSPRLLSYPSDRTIRVIKTTTGSVIHANE